MFNCQSFRREAGIIGRFGGATTKQRDNIEFEPGRMIMPALFMQNFGSVSRWRGIYW